MRRKQANLNKTQIDNIVKGLLGVRRDCKDPALLSRIDAMTQKIGGIPGVDSDEVIGIDVRILNDVAKLRTAVQKGSTTLTDQLFKHIEGLVEKHAEICYKSIEYPLGKKDRKIQRKLQKQNLKEEKRIERELKKDGLSVQMIDEKIAELQDENLSLTQECAELYSELQARFDEFKDAKLKEKSAKIASNKRKIERYVAARARRTTAVLIKDEEEAIKDAEKGTPTVEELKVKAGALKDSTEKARAEDAQIEGLRNSLYEAGPAVSAVPVSPVEANPYAGTVNPYANTQNPYAGTVNPYAGAQHGKMEDYFEDVDEQVGILEGTIKDIERAIGKKAEKLRELSKEITGLLEERKTATAAECVILDGKIDSRYSAYSTVKSGIDRLNQARANMSMELNIVAQIKDIRSVSEWDERIAELSNGRFHDIASLATAVNDDISHRNEIVADTRDAVAVANSTPIDSKTYAETGVTYEAGTKDEDKYAGLEREFGLRT